MEKSKEDNGANKNKKKDKTLLVHSESDLFNALKNKTPFQLGPSFKSIRFPLSIASPDNAGMTLKSLKDNTTIKSISFGRCKWDKTNLDALEKSLIANTSIDTLSCAYFSFKEAHKKFMKTIVKILTKNHRIQHVTFESIDDQTDHTLFDPFCNNIHLFGLKSLKILRLCNNHTSLIFNALPNSPTITSVKVIFAHQTLEMFNHMVDILMANPRITDMDIGSESRVISGDRWLRFKPVLERNQLKRLILRGLNYITNNLIQDEFDSLSSIFQTSTNLEELGFAFSNLNWTFLGNILLKNKTIKKLFMQHDMIEDFTVLKLDQNETLTEVSFLNCPKLDTKSLAEIIRYNTSIRKLQYETTDIRQAELDSFLRAFKNNSTLTDVQFEAASSDTPLCDLFAEVLLINRSIRRLKFQMDQNCEYESVCRLVDALKINTTLNELSFEKVPNLLYIGSQNKPQGAPTFDLLLADLLHVNESLTYFKGTEEFPEIDTALKRNLENQRKLITNGKMFVKMLTMRPRTYGGNVPPEIWCMILRHVTAPGASWNAEHFYRQNLS